MKIVSKSVKETLAIGRKISGYLGKGGIVCLFGQLGSGKTVLVKGMASGLGISTEKIISPTFVLVRSYSDSRLPFYHFDLYRLGSLKDILDLGYEEYLYGAGVSVIEWADRLKKLLPKEHLAIKLSIKGNDKRLLEFSAKGRHYEELLRSLRKDKRSK